MKRERRQNVYGNVFFSGVMCSYLLFLPREREGERGEKERRKTRGFEPFERARERDMHTPTSSSSRVLPSPHTQVPGHEPLESK